MNFNLINYSANKQNNLFWAHIAVALEGMQANRWTFSDAVSIWKELRKKLKAKSVALLFLSQKEPISITMGLIMRLFC